MAGFVWAAIAKAITFGLTGTHLLLSDDQTNELAGIFGVSGYPSYAFVDRAGRIRTGVITRLQATPVEKIRQFTQ